MGLVPIRGTLPDLGHRAAHLVIPGFPGLRVITNTIRLGPSDEVRAWLQRDTTLTYFAARCDAGTYRTEATPAGALNEDWAPVAPGRGSEAFSTVLCDEAPRTVGQRIATRVRWLLPPLPRRATPDLTGNPFADSASPSLANDHLERLRHLVDRRRAIARLLSWQERGRDTVTQPGVDSAAFALRVIAACDSLEARTKMLIDTLPDAGLSRCVQTWLSDLELPQTAARQRGHSPDE